MATETVIFNANQIRDFNTISTSASSTTIQANNNIPARLLDGNLTKVNPTHSDALNGDTITNWRMTFEVDGDHEAVPGSTVEVEFSVDGGTTWRNFYDESNLQEDGYAKYVVNQDGGANGPDDGQEWVSLVAYPDPTSPNPSTDADGTGFMISDKPITSGMQFTTDELANNTSEFTVLCFTKGMPIATIKGDVLIENLEIGDMVQTLDHGFQPIRFVYTRKVRAIGTMRPVVFEAGTLGNNKKFVVSQRHRILTDSVWTKNNPQKNALIEAIELVDGSTIRISDEMEYVEYVHLMFDNHELIFSQNIISESWQPHKRNLKRDAKLRDELLAIFPELGMKNSQVNGAPVRETITLR